MTTTDTSEAGLERWIVQALTGRPPRPAGTAGELEPPPYGGAGYIEGHPHDYDRDTALNLHQLWRFWQATQADELAKLQIAHETQTGVPARQLLHRLQGEITRRGVVDVLRNGIKHGPAALQLYYATPAPGNDKYAALHAANIFSVTRQLRYSCDETRRALDLVLFVNGLPLATFELKNHYTRQTVADAVLQYQRDRDPRELLFQFGRCAVHFAVDDLEVRFCTHLTGKSSWFLPFNRGWRGGAGNPPVDAGQGIRTQYLWREVLARDSLAEIIEHYAQMVEEEDGRGRTKRKQIWPRYHQLDVVRHLLDRAKADPVGSRYLVQHSAGSGKSNSIAWLAHRLSKLKRHGQPGEPDLFASVIVVTDRRNLDKQIARTIRAFDHVASVLGHSARSEDLARFLKSGKDIIVTTVQKFPHILDLVGDGHRTSSFALIIDEAHSSQGGKTAGKMGAALKPADAREGEDEDDPDLPGESAEDFVRQEIEARIAARRMPANVSYFAFTATPKIKTEHLFGEEFSEGGKIQRRPHHIYTMKQAIEEGFIRDVLSHYTPVESFFNLEKKVADDPEFDKQRALKKLHAHVEAHPDAIERKARVMVDHFLGSVIARRKVGGQARAMVVTQSRQRARDYFRAISDYLAELKSPYKAIVAFSADEKKKGGAKVTEADLNGFPSNLIESRFKTDPYRFLIVANKFTTGFDEPLLHSMYVDKVLADIQAVQTLSRLNRAHPLKSEVFVLDFVNDQAERVKEAFQRYYKTTLLAEETDPDRLHSLKAKLDAAQVYAWPRLEDFVARYLGGEDRETLDPIVDACRDAYIDLPRDQQVAFKGGAKSFVRTYGFLGCILPYSVAEWEKLFIFLQFLLPKLPAPADDDLSQGVLEAVDMESYRPEMRATVSLKMKDEDGELGPLPTGGGGGSRQPEMDRLSNILKEFNEEFGNIEWKDADKIKRVISVDIPERVAADQAYRNAMQFSDKQNARIEHDKALQRAILGMLTDQTELFKQFSDNTGFKQWLSERVFDLTYQPRTAQRSAPGAWRERAIGAVTTHFGPAAKWRGIGDGLADYFEDHAGEAIMLSGIELLAGKLQVAFEDVLTVLQVLAADDIRVLERTYTKSEGSAEESREVADGELRSGLASLYARGEIAAQGEQFAASVLVGWKPAGNGGEEART
ncbi:MAG: type I restriction endonuclease subunit R [Methylococcaceae bacterium]|nr:type I restriction endonuclease subunit R [Methylococcaceae bacterium]